MHKHPFPIIITNTAIRWSSDHTESVSHRCNILLCLFIIIIKYAIYGVVEEDA